MFEASDLAGKIVIESADVQSLVDLTVAPFVLCQKVMASHCGKSCNCFLVQLNVLRQVSKEANSLKRAVISGWIGDSRSGLT